jgi:ATP/ADP translocase
MFYLNYKRISATDSAINLMKKIIKTRKTVRNYVLFNLGYMVLVIVVATIASIQTNLEDLNNKKILFIVFASLIATLLILGILCLFYQLLYGLLLKKLNRNYKELAKLDTNS